MTTMAKPGTILASDRSLLLDALSALKKNKLTVVEQHIEMVLANMSKANSYSMPEKGK
jgi:septum formation topological specificity factor MinE